MANFRSSWSIHDIDDIEQTIYKLNQPISEDQYDDENFGWNSPIKFHRFAATPRASAKKSRVVISSPVNNAPRTAEQSRKQQSHVQHHVQFVDENSLPNTQRSHDVPFVANLDNLLKHAVESNCTHSPSPANILKSSQSPLISNIHREISSSGRSFHSQNHQQPAVDQEEFLLNAKKQLEFQLARERNDAVVKLKKILEDGAKSHIEQKRREVINSLVGQTDTILQQVREDILLEVHSLFENSSAAPSRSLNKVSRDLHNTKFRDIYKRIKIAEQEKIKQKVQLGVKQVANHMLQEEAALQEERRVHQMVQK